MDDKKLSRALTWVGAGGTALAASALVVAGMFAATPDGGSPLSELAPCFTPGCTAMTSAGEHAGLAAKSVVHSRRVTQSTTTTSTPPVPSTVAKASSPPVVKKVTAWSTSLPEQHLAAPIVAVTVVRGGSLVMVGSDGGVFAVGQAGFYGSLSGKDLGGPIVSVAADPATGGYWLVGGDGGVFSLNGGYYGSLGGRHLRAPVVGIVATPTGKGYWLVSADGGVFAFGDARFRGSLGGRHLGAPIVGMAATPTGNGYWLVGADGGVFAFGDAAYRGGLPSLRVKAPIVGIVARPSGPGYWLVSSNGGVFAFGGAPYLGADAAQGTAAGITAMAPTPSGEGYWLAGRAGLVLAYGDARPVETAPLTGGVSAAARSIPALAHDDLTRYRSGSTGFDISLYQCGDIPAARPGIAVVQVTGGSLDGRPNPCYRTEAAWAGANMSAYLYLDGLPSPTPAAALQGPAGTCSAANVGCQSYNYGYNFTRYWVAYSQGEGVNPKLWWLDVERYSGWNNPGSNWDVIRGALDSLHAMGLSSGIYSSAQQWNEITGGAAVPGEPEWVPGAGNLAGAGYTAASFCAQPGSFSFGGGRLALVQYGYSGPFPGTYSGPPSSYDQDYACRV